MFYGIAIWVAAKGIGKQKQSVFRSRGNHTLTQIFRVKSFLQEKLLFAAELKYTYTNT